MFLNQISLISHQYLPITNFEVIQTLDDQ